MNRELLTKDEIKTFLLKFSQWTYVENSFFRVFEFSNFLKAFKFMTEVAEIAEEIDHHPDWSNSWNKVNISISTHSSGGVSSLDCEFVKRVSLIESE